MQTRNKKDIQNWLVNFLGNTSCDDPGVNGRTLRQDLQK
jgi:hypothetical protein